METENAETAETAENAEYAENECKKKESMSARCKSKKKSDQRATRTLGDTKWIEKKRWFTN